MDYRLYFVLDSVLTGGHDAISLATLALQGGVTAIQLRCKECPTRDFLRLGRLLQQVCRSFRVPFIVNDRVDIAQALDADGVHLGQQDLPCSEARRILGPGVILGVSAENPEQAREAEADGADYIGAQTIFATTSKQDVGAAIGPEGLRRIVESVAIPVVGIGGIQAGNAAACMESGAAGVAVISAISLASDPKGAAAALRRSVFGAYRA